MRSLWPARAPDPMAIPLVPEGGFTARLVGVGAAFLAFLAVVLLGLGLAAGAVAERWQQELVDSATVRLPAETADAEAARVVAILEQTEGVESARLLSRAELRGLLQPWLGETALPGTLALPRMIAFTGGPDLAGLRFRLQGEWPSAMLDDHDRWRRPVVIAAARLERLALVSAGLVSLSVIAVLALAAQAALAANANVISVLRLVGARDRYIAGLFMRRFAWRSFLGAAAGSALGALTLSALAPGEAPLPVLGVPLGLSGLGWIVPAAIPVAAALIAALTTAAAAHQMLKETP